LAAGSNGTINIYNINDGNLVSSLKGHIGSFIFDLDQISDDLLASAGDDKTLRLWNLTTNTCKFTLTGHTNWVIGLKQVIPSLLASGYNNQIVGHNIRSINKNFNGSHW
jgi:WD40 repeat protein